MTQMLNNRYCPGCGAKLQVDDPNRSGYIPPNALARAVEKQHHSVYCSRCFKLRHYNEISPASLTDDDFLELLNDVAASDALVIYVLDALDLYGSTINGLQRFVGKNPVLVTVNKIDLLPKSFNSRKLKNYIKKRVKEQGINAVDVAFVSASKNRGIDELMASIENARKGRDVYVVGVANVGKSTIINGILGAVGEDKKRITTSYYPGTTLGRIAIPLDDGASIIDTPGIIQKHQLSSFLDPSDLKYIMPKKELRPITYQLNKGQTLFIGGVARLDYEGPKRGSVTCYLPNQLLIHRTRTSRADAFYQKHVGGILQPPKKSEPLPLKQHTYTVKEASDVVYSGLGWITINQPSQISAWAVAKNDIIIRPALFGQDQGVKSE